MGNFILLLASLMRSSFAKVAQSRGFGYAATGLAIADVINLDFLRQEAIKLAPGSGQEGIENAARTAARLLGLNGEEVLWPTHRRGPQAGEPIIPRYLTIDLIQGRAWYSSRHNTYRAIQSANRRGWNRGRNSGRRQGLQETQAYAKG